MAQSNNKNAPFYYQDGSVWYGKNFLNSSNFIGMKLKIYQDYLVACSWGKEIIKIHKSDVLYIQKYRWLSSIGLRIHHKKENEKPFVIFWTGLPNKMLSNLRKAGYEVQEGEEKSKIGMKGFFKACLMNIVIPLVIIIAMLLFLKFSFSSWITILITALLFIGINLFGFIVHFALYTPRK